MWSVLAIRFRHARQRVLNGWSGGESWDPLGAGCPPGAVSKFWKWRIAGEAGNYDDPLTVLWNTEIREVYLPHADPISRFDEGSKQVEYELPSACSNESLDVLEDDQGRADFCSEAGIYAYQ